MEVAVAHMSLAHTFGNVTAFITEYVKNLFPKNYFNTVNISSTVAYRYFNIFDNTSREFIKKRKPMLIIRPRIEFNDDNTFLNGTFLTSRITDNYMDLDYGNLQSFFSDQKNGLHIKFLMNRIKMSFDVSVIVEQQMEQINQFFYVKNRVRQEHPFYIKTFLESNLHKNMVKAIAKAANIDPSNSKAVLDYFNNNSSYPLTYKMKNSTGSDEFFRYYPAVVDTMFTGLTMDDGSKKGFISDAFTINFTVTTEFNTAGLYYFFSQMPEIIDQINIDIDADNSIIPIFTLNNLFDFITPPAGWNLFNAPLFKVSVDKGSDTLEVGDMFNSSIKTCITYHLEKGISLDSLMKIFVIKDNEALIEEDGDYSFDYEKLILTVNKNNTTSTYRFLVYINTLYINNLVAELHKIDEEK
jgi:hypothetical protein